MCQTKAENGGRNYFFGAPFLLRKKPGYSGCMGEQQFGYSRIATSPLQSFGCAKRISASIPGAWRAKMRAGGGSKKRGEWPIRKVVWQKKRKVLWEWFFGWLSWFFWFFCTRQTG
jgi:hypothetical protein